MGKTIATYRVDPVLLGAVKAAAGLRGETVTDVIIRALAAYVADDGGVPPARAPAEPGVRRGRKVVARPVPRVPVAAPGRSAHALACKCGICKSAGKS